MKFTDFCRFLEAMNSENLCYIYVANLPLILAAVLGG